MKIKLCLFLAFLAVISLLIAGCSKSGNEATGLVVGDEILDEVAEVVDEVAEEVADEVAEEVAEVVEEIVDEVIEEVTEVVETAEEGTTATNSYEVDINQNFGPKELTIKVGDSVTWTNTRAGNSVDRAMVIGVRNCFDVRSKILEPSESFTWTFTEAETCTIVDGIWTTMMPMKIIIEE